LTRPHRYEIISLSRKNEEREQGQGQPQEEEHEEEEETAAGTHQSCSRQMLGVVLMHC
jgi:hypothetical protein